MKAYYIPWGPELRRWALAHPEYSRRQVCDLATCVGTAHGVPRRAVAAFVAGLDAELADGGVPPG